ncbi:hypothetical protein BGW41_008073 [Actinomortierella wolfii]|nr:hypothetical protein BGW41_008073 [Actinomortierella wolfii]
MGDSHATELPRKFRAYVDLQLAVPVVFLVAFLCVMGLQPWYYAALVVLGTASTYHLSLLELMPSTPALFQQRKSILQREVARLLVNFFLAEFTARSGAMSLCIARLTAACRTELGRVGSRCSNPSTLGPVVVDQRLFSTTGALSLRSRPTLTREARSKALQGQKAVARQQVLATSLHSPPATTSTQGPLRAGQAAPSPAPAPAPPPPQQQQVVINQALYTQQHHSFQLHHNTTNSSSNHVHLHHPHQNSSALYSEPYIIRPPRRRSTFFSSRAHKDFARYVALLKSQANDPFNDPYALPWQYLYAAHHYRRRPFKTLAIGAVIGISGYTLYNDSVLLEKFAQLQSLVQQGFQTSNFYSGDISSLFKFQSSASAHPQPQPFSLPTSPFQKQQVKMLTPEQATQHLAKNQRAYKTATKEDDGEQRGPVVGYCTNQVASNNPIEDDLSKHVVRGRNRSEDQYFFGVFDGHGGWCCSHQVAQELAPYVAAELSLVSSRGACGDKTKSEEDVVEAIQRAFVNLDDKIVHEAVEKVLAENGRVPTRAMATSLLLPAISGSCALLAYIDARTNDLYVACTGDSRAVLGVKEMKPDGSHVWKAVPLSYDQTGRTKSEVLRMREEHPGEEDTVIMRGRVLGGLEPTRAFGDARYKWSREVQEKVFQLFPAYRQPNAYLKTPPYVTAKPAVKHHKLRPEDSFLVLATDGLWDKLTSDEVVQLVGGLLDGKKGVEETFLDRAKANIQSIEQQQELTPANLKPKGPESQMRQFTFRDRTNASTHLVRNALGGADDDKVAATLAIPAPMSRIYRDDITVTVVFFNEQDTKETLMEALEIDGLVEI